MFILLSYYQQTNQIAVQFKNYLQKFLLFRSKYHLSTALKQLPDIVFTGIQHHSFADEEIAIRCKHRIVQIHCFANGNGRHSRLMADVMMEKIFHLSPFTWGATNLVKQVIPDPFI